MVTADMEVYRVKLDGKLVFMDAQEYQDLGKDRQDSITFKKTVVAKGELLTMDDSEAHDLGFSSMSVAGFEEMLTQLKLPIDPSRGFRKAGPKIWSVSSASSAPS
jgi:membrane-bound serine protease (ClpP class)